MHTSHTHTTFLLTNQLHIKPNQKLQVDLNAKLHKPD